MYFLLENLCKNIGCRNIIIYGAGHYAIEIYKKICAIGWKDRIKNFVVTFMGTQPGYIDNIPVIEFDGMILDDDNYVILVAVSDAYINEIKDILSAFPLKRIFYLWDYKVTESEKRKFFLNGSFDALCQSALEEYIWNNPYQLENKDILLEELEAEIYKYRISKAAYKNIIYVLEEETARDIKIIKALLEKGYEISVLQYGRRAKYVAEKELLNLNIIHEQFDCVWEFMVKSLKYRPMLYFFDAETTFEYAAVSICHKDIWGRVVVAPYETFMGSFINFSEELFEDEKFCLENADAVVWRYFSKEYLENKMGYHFKGESIHLLDNCGGYELSPQLNARLDGRLKLCCVVAQIGCFLQADSSPYTRQAKFADILDKIDVSCELDIFAWSASEDEERQLQSLEKKYKNFKYFLKVEHKDLINRISTYDYGLCIWTSEEIPVYPVGAETITGGSMTCTEGTYRYSVANRYFDYIDAELPIITTLPEKLCEYLQQYDVVVGMNSSNLDVDYLKKNKGYYKEKAKAAKKELLMSKHISKLTDMFEKICSK